MNKTIAVILFVISLAILFYLFSRGLIMINNYHKKEIKRLEDEDGNKS